MLIKAFGFEVKELTDDGTFEGYASIFGNVDAYGDIVEKGAFKKTIKENPKPPILWQHNPDWPIGVTEEMHEDDTGLYVRGKLVMEVQQAREAHALMKAGATKGLSIGYRLIKWLIDQADQVRRLKEVKLMEWSPVTFPANTLARVTGVKGLLDAARWSPEALVALLDQAKTIHTTPDSDEVGGELLHAFAADTMELLEELLKREPVEGVPALLDQVTTLCERISTLRTTGAYGTSIQRALDIVGELPDDVYGDQKGVACDALSSLLVLVKEPPAAGDNSEQDTHKAEEPSMEQFATSLLADIQTITRR